MKNPIAVRYVCEHCKAQMAINYINIDLIKCEYVVFADCIACGNAGMIILALSDFVSLSRITGITGLQKGET